jgi:hypothetical protein
LPKEERGRNSRIGVHPRGHREHRSHRERGESGGREANNRADSFRPAFDPVSPLCSLCPLG